MGPSHIQCRCIHPRRMSIQLAHKLGLRDYFALAFGTMIGSGWLVLMDDWLGRGGPLGVMLGFTIGALVLLPVGYVYGEWVKRMPEAVGEATYTAQVFPPILSYFTGWMMFLAYFIVGPWEAVAVGKVAAYLFPAVNSMELYRVGDHPVYLPRLVLGIAMIVFLGVLNYRGIRGSASFQKMATTTVLALVASVAAVSAAHGSSANFRPAFQGAPIVSIFLVLQIVPYFLTGFESVPKAAEEAKADFPPQNFFCAIVLALLTGAGFYVAAAAAVSLSAPWQSLAGKSFVTALAFGQAMGTQWPVRVVLAAAMIGLLQCFNGNFVAASRMIFSFGRSGAAAARFGAVHSRFQTPYVAVIGISVATLIAVLLGDALLVPVTEVGSMASATGWFAASLSLFLLEKRPGVRGMAGFAAVISLLLVLMKIIPAFPGHFSRAEWIALAIWIALGWILHVARPSTAKAT